MTDDNRPTTPKIVEDGNENKDKQLARQNIKPDILYLVPITGHPHLPGQVQPLVVDKKRWGETLMRASKDNKNLLGLAYLEEVTGKTLYEKDFPKVGCVVRMENIVGSQECLMHL